MKLSAGLGMLVAGNFADLIEEEMRMGHNFVVAFETLVFYSLIDHQSSAVYHTSPAAVSSPLVAH
jgi:hypothetical protein